jgi:hypothetical protein
MDSTTPDTLVAEDATGRARRHVAFQDVQIGAADGRLGDPDDGVRRLIDSRLWSVFQSFLAGAMIYKSFHDSFLANFFM